MDTLLLFVFEVMLCLGISFALIWLLRPLLCDVLAETCGTEKRAGFWVMFTQLMLVISPLLVVVYFVPTETATHLNLALELQQALFRTLLGDFISLSIIGKVIWKSIANPNNQAALPIAEGAK
jgi:hypothetical protein